MFFKKNYLTLFLVLLISTFTSINLYAESVYISDELYVPIRNGQGNKFAILHKGIPSGTKLTLVERDKEWTKVTTSSGITGWVRNQFIDNNPPAKLQLSSANKKVNSLTKKLEAVQKEKDSLISQYQQEKNSLMNEYQQTQNLLKETQSKTKELNEEYTSLKAVSSSAVESHQRLQTIAQKMQLLQTENDVLKSENESLRRSESTTFFIYGAFAVLLGVLLAIMLPKLKPNKRNTGWIN